MFCIEWRFLFNFSNQLRETLCRFLISQKGRITPKEFLVIQLLVRFEIQVS